MKNWIQTSRLYLAPMTDDQMQALIAQETDPDTRQAYGEMLSGAQANPTERIWYAAWQIRLKTGEPVGDLCFKGTPRHGEVEIGYGMIKAMRGHGYATEAVTAMAKWAFTSRDVFIVAAETEPDNIASQCVLEKSGFKPGGVGAEGPRFHREKPFGNRASVGFGLGACAGVALGAATDNMELWLPIGLSAGLALGAVLDGLEHRRRTLLLRGQPEKTETGEKPRGVPPDTGNVSL